MDNEKRQDTQIEILQSIATINTKLEYISRDIAELKNQNTVYATKEEVKEINKKIEDHEQYHKESLNLVWVKIGIVVPSILSIGTIILSITGVI